MNLMQLVWIWLSTIALSYAVEFKVCLKLIKDIADAGYKINNEKIKELSDKINSQISNSIDLKVLNMIPLFNIYTAMKTMIEGTMFTEQVFLELKVLGAVEEMSEIEKEEYLNNPTGFNAIMVPIKVKERLSSAFTTKYNDFYSDGEIKFEYIDKKINILQVTGPASRLTVQEQEEIIKKNWKNSLSDKYDELGFDKLGFDDEFKDKFLRTFDIYSENTDKISSDDAKEAINKKVQELTEEISQKLENNNKDIKRKVLRKENDNK